MKPGDCELINEIFLAIRGQMRNLEQADSPEDAAQYSVVMCNMAEAARTIAETRKMVYESAPEGEDKE